MIIAHGAIGPPRFPQPSARITMSRLRRPSPVLHLNHAETPLAPRRLGIAAHTFALVAFLLPTAALAQEKPPQGPDLQGLPRPEVTVERVSGITVDGTLDEAAWGEIKPITDFVQAQPDDGAAATEDTEVFLGYDDDALYVGAQMYDSDPSGIISKSLERDSPGILSEEMDALGITLDTFLDRRNSFVFYVNPRGGLKDGQTFDNGRSRDYGWNGVVDVRTTIHERGWTLEMRIPRRTLRFDPGVPDQRWGLNLFRRIRRKNEVSYWAPLDRRNRIFLVYG
jgi:hypothetical protein